MPVLIALILLSSTFELLAGDPPRKVVFNPADEAWAEWSPRSEIRPKFSKSQPGRSGDSTALRIQLTEPNHFGAWRRHVTTIHPGQNYRFRAYYKAANIPHERRSIIPRLEWQNAKGNQVRPPEYAIDTGREGDWTRVELVTTAPTNAVTLDLQLSLGFASGGAIDWSDISLEETDPKNRLVRAVTINHRPRGTKSAAESVQQFAALALKSAPHRPDIIVLPEGITVVGNGKTYAEVSEAVPGPTTESLGQVARTLRSYIVAGIYERVGETVFNTAVLIDREGKLTGTYRKTHLPREEWEAGITPGDTYPVFDTDFGKVGLIVCWDVQFPEPSRAMALQGAEILLLPIWGGSETLAKARAIENHVFLISSSYDMKTFIVDPAGAVLAEATSAEPIAFAELRLDQKIYQPWLGDMKNRTWKERRPDIALEPRR